MYCVFVNHSKHQRNSESQGEQLLLVDVSEYVVVRVPLVAVMVDFVLHFVVNFAMVDEDL